MVSNLSSAWERDLEFVKNSALKLGKQEGRLEGRQEGRLEERKEIMLSLHEKGFDSQLIASVCKISVEDVNKIIICS